MLSMKVVSIDFCVFDIYAALRQFASNKGNTKYQAIHEKRVRQRNKDLANLAQLEGRELA
ncbi:MAG: hypothetical protein HQL64_07830 [Magnetococcales bacterium]|nr:hypothetical protein [Magnetococcales bacterium]